MNIKFLLPKARAFVEKGEPPKRASQRFRGLVPLKYMSEADGYIDSVNEATKDDIVKNWLPRYTGTELDGFGKYILLTNFIGYVNIFSEKYRVDIEGMDKAMQTATYNNITIIK